MTVLEFLNIIHPKHDRTSCSDIDVCNGYGSHVYEDTLKTVGVDGNIWTMTREVLTYRCIRCYYLEIINGTIEVVDGKVI